MKGIATRTMKYACKRGYDDCLDVDVNWSEEEDLLAACRRSDTVKSHFASYCSSKKQLIKVLLLLFFLLVARLVLRRRYKNK